MIQNKPPRSRWTWIAIALLTIMAAAAAAVAVYEYEAAHGYAQHVDSLLLGGVRITAVNGSPVTPAEAIALLEAPPRIGIVTPMAMEEAPILAAMKVNAVAEIGGGYTFYLGTIGNRSVVLVRSGEKEYAAELATYIMDTHFHVVAAILSGTAGSRNPNVRVGDVVVGGAFAVDKSSIHYHDRGGFQSDYTGVEMVITNESLIGEQFITTHGGEVGPSPPERLRVWVRAGHSQPPQLHLRGGPTGLAGLGRGCGGGQRRAWEHVPGRRDRHECFRLNTGPANSWRDRLRQSMDRAPLSWMEAQNALYETDAGGENEGSGFAYANSQLGGVPWVIIRGGISDSPWYPTTYHGVLAADRAAAVTIYVVTHFPSSDLDTPPATPSILSPLSNAAMHGYIVAERAYYNVTPVTEVQYMASNGSTVTTTGWPGGSTRTPPAEPQWGGTVTTRIN